MAMHGPGESVGRSAGTVRHRPTAESRVDRPLILFGSDRFTYPLPPSPPVPRVGFVGGEGGEGGVVGWW